MCQANFDLFIITPYGDYQRLIQNVPSRFKETGGFEWVCILNRSEGKKVPRDEMRIGERYSSRRHPGPFLFRDLILRRSAAVPMLLPKSYFQCCIDIPGLPGKL